MGCNFGKFLESAVRKMSGIYNWVWNCFLCRPRKNEDSSILVPSLETLTEKRSPRVPEFVYECVQAIESKEESMKTDGLYRVSGNVAKVQKILNFDNRALLYAEEDVHVLASCLKVYIDNLGEPLIPYGIFELVLQANRSPNTKRRIKLIKELMGQLPVPNWDTLEYLLGHFHQVQALQKFNRMGIQNLAVVWGPILIFHEGAHSMDMALGLMLQNEVVECLLENYVTIFGRDEK